MTISRARTESTHWYDLPRYYDIVHEIDDVAEADFLESVHRRFGRSSGRRRALEPACGTARLLLEMERRGWRVRGFDASAEMVRHARTKRGTSGSPPRVVQGRMESFRVPGRHDLAFCLVSTFKHLLTEKDARSHLACVARALSPGGVYVLGLHLSDYACTSRSRERWVGERDGVRVTTNLQVWPPDRRTRLEQARMRLRVEEGGTVRQFESHWSFRTYDAPQLAHLLRSVPELEHVATRDFDYEIDRERDLDDDRLDKVVILRRKG
jgi:SAM-dependent methyltransferase